MDTVTVVIDTTLAAAPAAGGLVVLATTLWLVWGVVAFGLGMGWMSYLVAARRVEVRG